MFLPLALDTHADISLTENSQALTLSNGEYAITQALGITAGNNLFHSFHTFNLSQNETATFSGAHTIENVIARVTGGGVSNIDGTLRNTIPNANTYLFNPAGILFGEHAQLDVQGGFHVSTADYLAFANGEKLFADAAKASHFSVSPPASFGFVSDSHAALSITGSQFNLPSGKDVSLVAGDVAITAQAQLRSSANVLLQADDFVLDNSSLLVSKSSGGENHQINLSAANISLTHGALISSQAENTAIGADIRLSAQHTIELGGQNADGQASQVVAATHGSGDGGAVSLTAGEQVLLTPASASREGYAYSIYTHTNSTSPDAGKGGEVFIRAPQIQLQEQAYIYTTTNGQANAGTIRLNAQEVNLENTTVISDTVGAGDAGDIMVNADGEVNLHSSSFYNFAFLNSEGDAGDVVVTAKNINLLAGSYFISNTFDVGNAGNVLVDVQDTFLLAGANAADGWSSGINADSNPKLPGIAGGDGGLIQIRAGELILRDGSNISASTLAPLGRRGGHGGNIDIQVRGNLEISGVNPYGENENSFASGIYARSLGVRDNTGQGGTIHIAAQNLYLQDGGSILSNTNNQADGGEINIAVGEGIFISGDASHIALQEPRLSQLRYLKDYSPQNYNQATSGIYATSLEDSEQAGNAGRISLSAQQLNLSKQAIISSATRGGQNAGNIAITVQHLQMDDSAKITSSSQMSNFYQFASEAERDRSLVVQGDIVTVADLGNAKPAQYINVDNQLIKLRAPVDSVANLAELNALADRYELSEGQIVTVTDAGDGNAARFIYTRDYQEQVDKWEVLHEQVDVILPDFASLDAINGLYYEHAADLPYPSGTRIRVQNMGDGKAADFIFSGLYNSVGERINGRVISVNQFNIRDLSELQNLAEHTSLRDYPLAILSDANGQIVQQFVYAKQQWIAFNNAHHVDTLTAMNALNIAKAGNIVELSQSQDTPQTPQIYTGQQWVSLNPETYQVSSLADLAALNAQTGDFVSVKAQSNAKPAYFFYADGAWQPQIHGGDAGNIQIHTEHLQLNRHSAISTAAESGGGGSINLQVKHLALLAESHITTSVQEGAGNGGDLRFNTDFLVQDQASIIARAVEGNGGNIQIQSKGIFQFGGANVNPIDASSQFGVSGQVEVVTPEESVSGSVFVVNGQFVQQRISPFECAPITSLEELSRYRESSYPTTETRTAEWFQ